MMFIVVFLCIVFGIIVFLVQMMCGYFGCILGQREQGVYRNDISIYCNKIDSIFNGLNVGDFVVVVRYFNVVFKVLMVIGVVLVGFFIIR